MVEKEIMTKLFKHQKKAHRTINQFNGRCLVSHEMGLGKTLTSLSWGIENKKFPIIVVCPASLKWNWKREVKHHFGMKVRVLKGQTPDMNLPKRDITIINYDILQYWLQYIQDINPKLLIIDECHMIGSRTTKRTKSVKYIARGVPHVLALSGTPLVNRPAELWNTLNIIKPRLFPTFFHYALEYCGAKRNRWGWEYKGATNIAKLHQILLDNVMDRCKKSDTDLDLPEKMRIVMPFEIESKEYDFALNNFKGWLQKNRPDKADASWRAKQVTQLGYLKQLAAKAKLPIVIDWVDDFLQESSGKLILFGIHKEILKVLKDRYKNICVSIDGETAPDDRQIACDRFQNADGVRLFIGQIKAAGVGLNLTAAETVGFVELGWTPGEHTQGEDRCHRIGTRNAVSCYYFVAKDTIEEKLLKIIQEKQQNITRILDGRNVEEGLDLWDQLCKEMGI